MSVEICFSAHIVKTGLSFALEVGEKPVLCVIAPNLLRLIAAHNGCMVLRWEHALERETSAGVFIVPTHIARLLTGGVLGASEDLCLTVEGQDVLLKLTDSDMPAALSWHWTPPALGAPAELEHMLTPPPHPINVQIADLVAIFSQAAARTLPPGETEDVRRSLVPVRPVARTITVAGRSLAQDHDLVAYFDPPCLTRVGQWLASCDGAEGIQVDVMDLDDKVAVLTLLGVREGWRVQCAIKSVMVERAAERASPVAQPASPAPQTASQPAPPEAPAPEPRPSERPWPDMSAFAAKAPASANDAPQPVIPAARPEPSASSPEPTSEPVPRPAVAAFRDTAIPEIDADAADFLVDIQPEQSRRGRDSTRRPAHFDVPLD